MDNVWLWNSTKKRKENSESKKGMGEKAKRIDMVNLGAGRELVSWFRMSCLVILTQTQGLGVISTTL